MFLFFLLSIILSTQQPLVCLPDLSTLTRINYLYEASNVAIVKSFPEYADNENYRTPPHSLRPESLATFNPHVDWNKPDTYNFKHTEPPYIARIKNAYIASDQLGTIFDNEQQLLFRLWLADKKFRCDGTIFWQVPSYEKNYKIKYLPKIATVQGPTLYYHWIMDRMPSIYLLKELLDEDPEVKLLINTQNGRAPEYVEAFLDLLGISRNQIIFSEPRTLYFGQEVYFATPFLVEPIPQKLLLDLRQDLLKGANVSHKNKTKKNILILQREEQSRHLLNLDDIVQSVKNIFPSKDFEITILFASGKTATEQIKLFHQADLVIAAHGSGLANTLFSRAGTPVIEIHPDNLPYEAFCGLDLFWWLSSAVGLEHWVIQVPTKDFQRPMSCPIGELDKILSLLKTTFA